MACKAGALRQLAESPASRLRLMRALEPLDWGPLVDALSWPPVSVPLCPVPSCLTKSTEAAVRQEACTRLALKIT